MLSQISEVFASSAVEMFQHNSGTYPQRSHREPKKRKETQEWNRCSLRVVYWPPRLFMISWNRLRIRADFLGVRPAVAGLPKCGFLVQIGPRVA